MVARIIDVLTDKEHELTTMVSAAQRNLLSINNQVKSAIDDHTIICVNITRDKKARDVLAQELHDLGERVATRKSRTDPDAAEEAYKVLKPYRYDIVVYQVPNRATGGSATHYVKMWWGNVAKVIYEGHDVNRADRLAQKITDLTGRESYRTCIVKSKKDIWK